MDNGTPDGVIYKKDALDWTNAYLPDDQMKLLEETLADKETKNACIFLHQNLDPNAESHHIIRNAAEIRRILRNSGKVRAVYQGHYHPGTENTVDGIPYVTLPAMCEGENIPYKIAEI